MHLHRRRTADLARGRWPGILEALGVEARFLRYRHGPCPMCGGKDRFRFDDKNGLGTWFCNQCGSGDGFTLLRYFKGWAFDKAAKAVDGVIEAVPAGAVEAERSEVHKVWALRKVWTDSREVAHGDPVWRYLNARTGIKKAPMDIRFHPSLRYRAEDGKDQGEFPAMLALLRDPDGNGVTIHRTYLTDAGDKAPVPNPKKIMPGKALSRAAVRLAVTQNCIGIAEGIETALAASLRFDVPVWAATSAGLLQNWEPPVGVKLVLIAGDNDANYTGQAAAFVLARRLLSHGLRVEVQIPGMEGKDWADLGMSRKE